MTRVLPLGSNIPKLDADTRDQIHHLWDEIAAHEAAQTDNALLVLMRRVCELVDAQNGYWFGAVQVASLDNDPLLGWRPQGIHYLHPLPEDSSFSRKRIRSIQKGAIDESTVAHARLAGKYRACRLRDLVSAEWFKSEIYQGYVDRGVFDSLVVGAPVSPKSEVYYGFLRMRADDPFTEKQRDIALYAMRGLTWFHRKVLLAYGLLIARSPLTPTERKVLALLLTERSEKAIASELGIAASSVHTYVRDVVRKFGVSGRKGLAALWLGRHTVDLEP